MRRNLMLAATLLLGGLLGGLAATGWFSRDVKAEEKPAAGKEAEQPSAEMAAVRKTADEFTRAFNAGDARAVAAFWTKDGEFVGPDGETVRGRADIEKLYTEFFRANPKARLEAQIDSVRILGRSAALEEGALKLRLPNEPEPSISRYSVLHVRDDGRWHMASVREWVPDPQELVSVKDVEWLVGTWTASGPEAGLRITYAWDEDRAFLRGRYVLTKGDTVVNAGTQIIGKNPGGGLRSWHFDKSGTFGESVWAREENRWVIEAAGTLPDGSEVTAINLLIPLGKDAFTWQTVERTAAGSELPSAPPVKVTRTKAAP
jgi:uncharacterized protein (TIGR02246 family)